MGKKTVRTISDLAELAGVSKSTVSRALSGSPLISEQTRERIQRLAREHDYQVNLPARRLSLKKSNSIAFVTCGLYKSISIEDLFTLELLGTITEALAQQKYDLLMVNVDPYDTKWPAEYLNTGRVEGFILMTSYRKQQHIRSLLELQAPFIVWGVPDPRRNYCTVTGDNFSGGRQATEHLIETGRRRIVFLGGPEFEREVQLRHDGYLAALKEAGLEPDSALSLYAHYSSEAAAQALSKLLDQKIEFDAVFTNSDIMAISVIATLRQRGCRVPEDVAVVGYDDLSIAQHATPPLTTISQHLPMAARQLVSTLLQNLQTGQVANVTVPVDLVVRGSSVSG